MDNRAIAARLIEWAHLLEARRENLYRIQAYRRAAETIIGLDEPVEEMVVNKGAKSLRSLPGIGVKLSTKIETLVRAAEISTLKEDSKVLKQVASG